MQNYKDLKVWSLAHQFTLSVYRVAKLFPKEEMFGITNQLRRAASSIGANIAEGGGRFTQGAFAKFLQLALGSANESEYFLILSNDLQYVSSTEFGILFKQVNEVKAMLISLIQKIKLTPDQQRQETPKT